MSLEVQFQSFVASFLYGLGLGFGYGFFNRACFNLKIKLLRWGLEIFIDSFLALTYFMMIVFLNGGHFNLYLYLALGLGLSFYIFYFARGYLFYLEYLMRFFRWFFFPFRFIFSKIRAILKHVRKVWQDGKNKEDKTQ